MAQHEALKARLRVAGSSFAIIARNLNIQPTTVSATSLGKRRSRRIEAAIADALGTTPEAIWSDRYPAHKGGAT